MPPLHEVAQLPSIYLPRTWMNTSERKGESYWASSLPTLLVRLLIEDQLDYDTLVVLTGSTAIGYFG
jgi:hypothetical protein